MKIGRWVRFPHVSAMIFLFIIIFLSNGFGQGMYIDSNNQNTVYSLNSKYSSLNNNNNILSDYSLGVSTIINTNNEISFDYNKADNLKSYIASYFYYIRPNFFVDFNLGLSYAIRENQINVYRYKIGVFRKLSKMNKGSLRYFPFLNYKYIVNEKESSGYDLLEIGLSVLFNDIGIETSYSFISNKVSQINFKIYLWEKR